MRTTRRKIKLPARQADKDRAPLKMLIVKSALDHLKGWVTDSKMPDVWWCSDHQGSLPFVVKGQTYRISNGFIFEYHGEI